MPKLAYSGGCLTPEQLRALADMMDKLGIEAVDLIPQISETKGRWFRLDGDSLKTGQIRFEGETKEGD